MNQTLLGFQLTCHRSGCQRKARAVIEFAGHWRGYECKAGHRFVYRGKKYWECDSDGAWSEITKWLEASDEG